MQPYGYAPRCSTAASASAAGEGDSSSSSELPLLTRSAGKVTVTVCGAPVTAPAPCGRSATARGRTGTASSSASTSAFAFARNVNVALASLPSRGLSPAAATAQRPRDSPPAAMLVVALAGPASFAAPRASMLSSTPVCGAFERLLTTETSTASSPAVNARGTARRASTSFVTSVFATAVPTSVASVAPRAVARQPVRLSGQRSVTLARPSAPVRTAGAHSATSRKSRRTSPWSPLSAPP